MYDTVSCLLTYEKCESYHASEENIEVNEDGVRGTQPVDEHIAYVKPALIGQYFEQC